jgi:hypothetical protein
MTTIDATKRLSRHTAELMVVSTLLELMPLAPRASRTVIYLPPAGSKDPMRRDGRSFWVGQPIAFGRSTTTILS